MVIVIRCDVCQGRLGRDVVSLSFTKTARLVDKSGDARIIDSGESEDYLLCGRCACYVERCVGVRERQGAAS